MMLTFRRKSGIRKYAGRFDEPGAVFQDAEKIVATENIATDGLATPVWQVSKHQPLHCVPNRCMMFANCCDADIASDIA